MLKKIFTFKKPKKADVVIKKFVQYSLNKKRLVIYGGKSRSDVIGSGKKKRRQKGSGSSRMSDGFAPQFRGGGVAFGPNGRKYDIKINKKEKNCAIKAILFNKLENGLLLTEKSLDFKEISTSKAKKWIDKKELILENRHRILFIDTEFSENFKKSTNNLKNTDILPLGGLNALSLLKTHYIILSQRAVDQINKKYGDKV